MIGQLIARLEQTGLELNAEEIADVLWLANQIKQAAPESVQTEQASEQPIQRSTPISSTSANVAQTPRSSLSPSREQPAVSAYSSDTLPESSSSDKSSPTPEGLPFKAPAAPALRNSLALARALRPLMRKVPSRTESVLDEEGTARQIAEYQVWSPVLQPARERWLELVLVVEETRTTVVWQETIAEFQKLMERHGAFRNVYTWSLQTKTDGTPELFPFQQKKPQKVQTKQLSRSPKELLDATGRRLILLISDCISPLWWQGEIHKLLELWGNHVPVAVLQLLPEQLWERTVLGLGTSVQLGALAPGVLNSQLIESGLPIWQEEKPTMALKFPVVTLEPESLTEWARVVAGAGSVQTLGVLFEQNWKELVPKSPSPTPQQPTKPDLLVKRFHATASPLARKLAGFMAAAPVSLPVIHLIQQELLPESRQIHLAEIFMSGLLQFVQSHKPSQPERWQYKFVDGVREILLSSVRITEIDAVLEAVSQYIARKAGLQIKSFAALLAPNPNWDISTRQEVIPFAKIAMQVLRQLGEDYAALAEQLEQTSQVIPEFSEESHNSPKILTFEFEVATISIEAETETPLGIPLNRVQAIKAKELNKRLEILESHFEAVYNQLNYTENAQSRNKLQRQLKRIEQDMNEVAHELQKLELGINLQPFEFEVALIEVNQSAQISTSSFPKIVDEMVFTKTGQHLNKFEQLILQGTLANQTYEQISESTIYSARHFRNVALKLWKVLSEVLGEKVTKKNLQNVLEQWTSRPHLTIHRHRQQAQEFIEDLGNGVQLEMVAIPSGSFVMGSPEDEPERYESESPQHTVTIKSFFLGKYPVTQAQWKAVASLPQVNRELDPEPSRFKKENRPVEQVSWYDAVEFCDRLSKYTGKPYRLPSEAEWEYSCRAGTTTPFHFGERITSELANYNADYTYGAGVKGVYRRQTTPVGSFGVANAFGLYDMHGNVWEWCADHWHYSYEGAPVDGSAWLDVLNEADNYSRVLRGGSWIVNPKDCRSGTRNGNVRAGRDLIDFDIGFRVVCAFERSE